MVLGFLLLQSASQGSALLGLLPFVLMFAVFYFLLFLPMQRQKKAQQRMLAELKNGDSVTTSGGLIGTVHSLTDDRLVLRVKPDNVKIEIARSSVSSVVSAGEK